MQNQGSLGGVDRPAIATGPNNRQVPTKQRAWNTSPLWMQLLTIAAAILLLVWLVDEIF
jgi:hypothetical protein